MRVHAPHPCCREEALLEFLRPLHPGCVRERGCRRGCALGERDLDEENVLGTSRHPTGMITLFTMYLTTLGIAAHYVLTTLP